MVMAGCTNGDRVDEVRVGHVGQVGHGAVLVSRVRSVDDERSRGFYGEKKSFREKFQRKLPTLHFLLGFLHRDRAWVCAPKGTYYRADKSAVVDRRRISSDGLPELQLDLA